MICFVVYSRGARRRRAVREWARRQPPGEVQLVLEPACHEGRCAAAAGALLAVVDLADGVDAALASIEAARASGAIQVAAWSGPGVDLDGEVAALRAGALELLDIEGTADRRLPSFATWLARYAGSIASPDAGARPACGAEALPDAPVPLALIAASTGGPDAIMEILSGLPAGLPAAIAIVQHMDRAHLPGTRDWLARETALPIVVPEWPVSALPGTVYLARGGDHLVVRGGGVLAYTDEPRSAAFRPSGDVLFESAVRDAAGPVLGIVLTGMGADGARGLLALRQAGHRTIAQDEQTSSIYGMPKAAALAGAVERVQGVAEIAPAIVAWARATQNAHPRSVHPARSKFRG